MLPCETRSVYKTRIARYADVHSLRLNQLTRYSLQQPYQDSFLSVSKEAVHHILLTAFQAERRDKTDKASFPQHYKKGSHTAVLLPGTIYILYGQVLSVPDLLHISHADLFT